MTRLCAFRRLTGTLALLLALLAQSVVSFAFAEDAPPARLRGTIESIDGRLFTIKSRDGASFKVRLAEKARIGALVKASLDDIKKDSFVGITSLPD